MKGSVSVIALLLLSACRDQKSAPVQPGPSAQASPSAPAKSETSVSVQSARPRTPQLKAAAPFASAAPQKPTRYGAWSGDETDLEAFNAWATAQNLRDDLLSWVSFGLPLDRNNPKQVSVAFSSAEAPTGATVTVVDEGLLDDSVHATRYRLLFSRKACGDCGSGWSPWWLWKVETTYRCQPGRGHEDFSSEPCR